MKSKASSPKGICWGPTIIAANKTKKNRKQKTTDAPRKTHNV
jgi:hypothetical protein